MQTQKPWFRFFSELDGFQASQGFLPPLVLEQLLHILEDSAAATVLVQHLQEMRSQGPRSSPRQFAEKVAQALKNHITRS